MVNFTFLELLTKQASIRQFPSTSAQRRRVWLLNSVSCQKETADWDTRFPITSALEGRFSHTDLHAETSFIRKPVVIEKQYSV